MRGSSEAHGQALSPSACALAPGSQTLTRLPRPLTGSVSRSISPCVSQLSSFAQVCSQSVYPPPLAFTPLFLAEILCLLLKTQLRYYI